MENSDLIFTFSGIRGIITNQFNFDTIKKIGIAFGLKLNKHNKKVIVGRDTRPSGLFLEKKLLEGLVSVGCEIIHVGICPSPVIIHAKNNLNIPAAIIITGSHNPQEWNGLKLISYSGFLGNKELEEIKTNMKHIKLKDYSLEKEVFSGSISSLNPIPEYITRLYKNIEYEDIKRENNLRVVLDTGAGAGKVVTPQILQGLGCKVKLINNDLLIKSLFPREIEPIARNLTDLIMEVWQGNYDLGFAHDSDADRLALIGEDGTCYPEDVVLALITNYYLKKYHQQYNEIFFITNLASSLMFEALADNYNAQVIRVPIGEKFLIEKIEQLIKSNNNPSKNTLIMGGEGSCGGVILPNFNTTRDGIFAAAKIVEILIKTGRKLSALVAQLPKYYSYRETIEIKNRNIPSIIKLVKIELLKEGEEVTQINNDIKFGQKMEWFVLIHPSNTQPIIRIISEAKSDSLARIHCEVTAELVKLVLARKM